MRAVRLTQVGKSLENADVPVPEIGPTEVLIRVAAAGICHSDAHYRAGISKIDRLPLTLGDEVAGRVEEVGSDVTHLSAGDRVWVHYLVHCGSCEFCVRGLEQFCCAEYDWQTSGRRLRGIHQSSRRECVSASRRDSIRSRRNHDVLIGNGASCSNKARFKAGESIAIFGSRTWIFGIAIWTRLRLQRCLRG